MESSLTFFSLKNRLAGFTNGTIVFWAGGFEFEDRFLLRIGKKEKRDQGVDLSIRERHSHLFWLALATCTVIAGISSAQGAVGIESFVPGFIVLSHVTPRAVKIRNDSFAEFIQLFVRDLGFETFFNFWGHSLCCKL